MFFKITIYIIYMIFMRMKGLKYNYLKKIKGQDLASEYVQKVAYLWSEFTLNIIGIDLDVTGKDNIPNEPCVFIGNHSSILDIPIILYSSNKKMGFIAKKELLKTPFIGYWIKRSGSVPIDRENPKSAIKSINDGVENLKNGYSLGIFPEGTRNKEGKVGEFKRGSLKLATKSKVPIVPVSIDRASRSFEDNKKFKPNKIKVVYGKPIYTNSLSKEDEKLLMNNIRNTIISNLNMS